MENNLKDKYFKKINCYKKRVEKRNNIVFIIEISLMLISIILLILNSTIKLPSSFNNIFLYIGLTLLGIAIILLIVFKFLDIGSIEASKCEGYIEELALKEIYDNNFLIMNSKFNKELLENNPYFLKASHYYFSKSYLVKLNNNDNKIYFTEFDARYIYKDKNGIDIYNSLKGKLAILDYKKNDKSSSYLYVKTKKASNFVLIDNIDNNHKILTESNEFNDLFDIFSNDDLFSYKILTPKTIINLINLYKNVLKIEKSNELFTSFSLFFIKGKVYIYLPYNLFNLIFSLKEGINDEIYLKFKRLYELPLEFYNSLNIKNLS